MTVRAGSVERLDLEQYSAIPLFNTKAVVQQTGVPAPTLRAWERRYTLLSPERADNDYRLYSERDIVLIRWLKERVDTGMAISHAVTLFRHLSEETHQSQTQKETLLSLHDSFSPQSPAFQIVVQSSQTEKTAKAQAQPEEVPSPYDAQQMNGETTQATYSLVYSMHLVREGLLEAFNRLDEPTAHALLASMLAVYPVEQVCMELITPTMWQIGQLWAEGQLTVPIEHFASNVFRALLTNLYRAASSPAAGPLIIVCSAPGEPHELAPLMLALFLRRTGMRVVYLGQSIETSGLLQIIKQVVPALLCISLTLPAYLPALIDMATQICAMSSPPLFTFGGQVFSYYPSIVQHIPGTYLYGDLRECVVQLNEMLKDSSPSQING